MRKLVAALGAIVLIATVTAAPVAAHMKPLPPPPSFDVTMCSTTADGATHYEISVSWSGYKGVSELVTAAADEGSYLGAYESTTVVKGETGVAGLDVIASWYEGHDDVAVGLLNHRGTQLVWYYQPITGINPCS